MKPLKLLLFLPLVFFSCNTATKQSTGPDSVVSDEKAVETHPQTICFQHLEGTANQDTAFIHLEISGNNIKGVYNNIPYEKDSRKGTLKGIKQDDLITATWYFMQEGVNDSLPVELKLNGNKLYQKAYLFDTKTGREILADSSAFKIEFSETDCRN